MPNNIKAFNAGEELKARRFVKFSSNDNDVVYADDANSMVLGVTTEVDTAQDKNVDVQMDGLAEVELGGAVTRGQRLVPSTDGVAVAASTIKGSVQNTCAIALKSGVTGDEIPIKIENNSFTLPGLSETLVASGAIGQGQAVKRGSDDTKVALATNSTESAFGIALASAADGESVEIQMGGIAEAIADANVTRGQLATVGATSGIVPASPSAGAACNTLGLVTKTALSGAASELIIIPSSKTTPA